MSSLADGNEFVDIADVADFLDWFMYDGNYLSYLGRQVRLRETGVQVLSCQVLYRSYQFTATRSSEYQSKKTNSTISEALYTRARARNYLARVRCGSTSPIFSSSIYHRIDPAKSPRFAAYASSGHRLEPLSKRIWGLAQRPLVHPCRPRGGKGSRSGTMGPISVSVCCVREIGSRFWEGWQRVFPAPLLLLLTYTFCFQHPISSLSSNTSKHQAYYTTFIYRYGFYFHRGS
jgi:hypothetical protein